MKDFQVPKEFCHSIGYNLIPTVEEMQGRLEAGLDPLASAGAPALARRVAKLAGDEPEQVARVMRGWIADGGR